MGYIDGILDQSRLSGIGKLEFLGASELVMNEYIAGYILNYRAVHGQDDKTAALDPDKPAPQDLGGGAW